MASIWRKMKKSLVSRFSSSSSTKSDGRSLPSKSSTGSQSFQKQCAICLADMKTGQGALFTAECSHSFHFSCIATNSRHGKRVCPICRAKWKTIPFQNSNNISDPQRRNGVVQTRGSPSIAPTNNISAPLIHYSPPLPTNHPPEPQEFCDDEPLPSKSENLASPAPLSSPKVATVKALTEFPAVSALESSPSFDVLINVRAPPCRGEAQALGRAPIDLVTVLDISGSMCGSKLSLVKHALHFVIQSLSPSDRLSIVTFSSTAQRLFPLRKMTDSSRRDASIAVKSLKASGGTAIVEGLKKGIRVIEERRELNPVASIILLSDGKDTDRNRMQKQTVSNTINVLDYMGQLPDLIRRSKAVVGMQQRIVPVHTFGFGADHDSAVMHAISDASGGTFSFIESFTKIQDAFAMCLGGLLSIVVQESRLMIKSVSSGVKIRSISSGNYTNEILDQGLQGAICVGNLYAEEEKEFIVCLSIPVALEGEGQESPKTTSLLDIFCSYRDSMSQDMVHLKGERVVIPRPDVLSSIDRTVCLEIDRQRNRLLVAKGIEEANELAEKGRVVDARALLSRIRSTLSSSASAQASDALCNWLESELHEISNRMVTMESYEDTGRAYVLSGMSSHSWQRATTTGDSTSFVSTDDRKNLNTSFYGTSSMANMVTKSQTFNLEHKQP